jgi:hypothetical protein
MTPQATDIDRTALEKTKPIPRPRSSRKRRTQPFPRPGRPAFGRPAPEKTKPIPSRPAPGRPCPGNRRTDGAFDLRSPPEKTKPIPSTILPSPASRTPHRRRPRLIDIHIGEGPANRVSRQIRGNVTGRTGCSERPGPTSGAGSRDGSGAGRGRCRSACGRRCDNRPRPPASGWRRPRGPALLARRR